MIRPQHYEVDGVRLCPCPENYRRQLSAEEEEATRRVVALQAALDSLACRLRWTPMPPRYRA